MNKFIILLVAIMMVGCTDEESSREALENQGFTDITFTGYGMFSCSDDDAFKTDFRAKNPQGRVVTGTVCCGWFKSCTVRW